MTKLSVFNVVRFNASDVIKNEINQLSESYYNIINKTFWIKITLWEEITFGVRKNASREIAPKKIAPRKIIPGNIPPGKLRRGKLSPRKMPCRKIAPG